MKKRTYLFSILAVALLIGISTLTLVLGSNDDSEIHAEEKTEIKNNSFLDSFNKINVALKKKHPNSYVFKKMDLHNGDLFLLNEENKGLALKKGDSVEIDLSIIPDGTSATGVGYILNGNYTEIFSASVTDQLMTDFYVEEDGEYIICIIGFNANFITITEGVISIN
ncbi:hypothetical protein WAX74_15080 [Psychrobacillus sp. FJAT-51614]|uniref:Lipoprotein n=1 Tax=Psychrobacillus mangrovi TaxID=3117745 RepID=A0ABU8F7F4_9BACI